MKRLMIFDVESIGLWGEGFCVGWIIYDSETNDVFKDGFPKCLGLAVCSPKSAKGTTRDRQWVGQNVRNMSELNCDSPLEVRSHFWNSYEAWGKPPLMADVGFPVEYNFLREVYRDDKRRQMPYPLLDASSVRLAMGRNPLGDYESSHDTIEDVRLTFNSIRL